MDFGAAFDFDEFDANFGVAFSFDSAFGDSSISSGSFQYNNVGNFDFVGAGIAGNLDQTKVF